MAIVVRVSDVAPRPPVVYHSIIIYYSIVLLIIYKSIFSRFILNTCIMN